MSVCTKYECNIKTAARKDALNRLLAKKYTSVNVVIAKIAIFDLQGSGLSTRASFHLVFNEIYIHGFKKHAPG